MKRKLKKRNNTILKHWLTDASKSDWCTTSTIYVDRFSYNKYMYTVYSLWGLIKNVHLISNKDIPVHSVYNNKCAYFKVICNTNKKSKWYGHSRAHYISSSLGGNCVKTEKSVLPVFLFEAKPHSGE